MKFVQENIWLVLIAVASGLGLLWPLVARRLSGIPQMSVTEAVQLINRRDPLVLDVREQDEWDARRVSRDHGPSLAKVNCGGEPRVELSALV